MTFACILTLVRPIVYAATFVETAFLVETTITDAVKTEALATTTCARIALPVLTAIKLS
jgi:hypothetical protein